MRQYEYVLPSNIFTYHTYFEALRCLLPRCCRCVARERRATADLAAVERRATADLAAVERRATADLAAVLLKLCNNVSRIFSCKLKLALIFPKFILLASSTVISHCPFNSKSMYPFVAQSPPLSVLTVISEQLPKATKG